MLASCHVELMVWSLYWFIFGTCSLFSKTLSLSLFFVPVGPGRVSHLLILIQLKSHKSYYVHGAHSTKMWEAKSILQNKPSICMIFPTKKSIIELKLDSCENLVVKVAGVFKVCPRNKVHALCKIHKIKCRGFLAEERVAKTGLRN